MKKKGSWLAAGIYILIGAGAGVLIGRGMKQILPDGASTGLELATMGLLLLALYASAMLQIAVHEAGHYAFGRMTGYRFVSYRIFSLMWLKDDSGLRFCRFTLAGTGGQCLMEPPGTPEGGFPVTLYNLGGSLMNLIASAICLALAWLARENALARLLLELAGAVGVAFALVNGIPLKLGMINNDGRNALDLRRDAAARRAFWIQMKMNALTSRGVRLKDMPEAWFALPGEAEMQNALTASIAVFASSRLMDQRRFDEADALMAGLLEKPGAIPEIYRALMAVERIYCELIGSNRPEAVEALLDKSLRRTMKALKGMPSVMRTEYALALLKEKDAERARRILRDYERIAKHYPYPTEIETERELMQKALERA